MRNLILSAALISLVPTVATANNVVRKKQRYDLGDRWDVLAGGLPQGPVLQAEGGFSDVALSFHLPVNARFSAGGIAAFDYAHYAPADSFARALRLGAVLRWGLLKRDKFSLGLRAEPGLYFGFSQPRFNQFIFGVAAGVGLNLGYRLEPWMQVGGGVEVPLLFGVPADGRDVFVAAPILFGPTIELYPFESWAFTAELRMGPHLLTDEFYGTRFGLRAVIGLAYRL